MYFIKGATLKGLRRRPLSRLSQLLQSCDEFLKAFLSQGFRANPGLEFANAFSVPSSERGPSCTV